MVASVLTAVECKCALALMWDWLEAAAPEPGQLQRDDPSTWHHWPPTVEGGILPYRGAGQSKAAWFVRSRLPVARAFASVWGTEAPLVTSFDGISAWRPWQVSSSPSATCTAPTHRKVTEAAPTSVKVVGSFLSGSWVQALWLRLRAVVDNAWEVRRRRRWRTEAGWFHMDQNPLLKPVLCYFPHHYIYLARSKNYALSDLVQRAETNALQHSRRNSRASAPISYSFLLTCDPIFLPQIGFCFF